MKTSYYSIDLLLVFQKYLQLQGQHGVCMQTVLLKMQLQFAIVCKVHFGGTFGSLFHDT